MELIRGCTAGSEVSPNPFFPGAGGEGAPDVRGEAAAPGLGAPARAAAAEALATLNTF